MKKLLLVALLSISPMIFSMDMDKKRKQNTITELSNKISRTEKTLNILKNDLSQKKLRHNIARFDGQLEGYARDFEFYTRELAMGTDWDENHVSDSLAIIHDIKKDTEEVSVFKQEDEKALLELESEKKLLEKNLMMLDVKCLGRSNNLDDYKNN